MARTIDAGILPEFYRRYTRVCTYYVFSIDGIDDYKYIANSSDIDVYTACTIKRGPFRMEEGTVLNDLEIGLDNVDLAFRSFVMSGKLNNKLVKIGLAFINEDLDDILGTLPLYQGYIDEPKGDEHWVTVTLRPYPLLEREFPRRVFQFGCNWSFCDQFCGKLITNYLVETTLTAQSDGAVFTCSHGQAADYFIPGYIELLDGAYADEVRPILTNDATTVTVRVPFGHTVANGTSVRLQKLCARNPMACEELFDNYDNYGGFPLVPPQPII